MTEPDTALTEAARTSMPFAEVLGLEILFATGDEVQARIAWQERLCTAGGILHGGALMSLADAAGAFCAFLNLPEGSSSTATIESKTNFFRAVREGSVVEARSRPLHRGRTTIVVETDVHDAAGKHVARVTQTQAILGG
jgi:1,4-dihydroxy-2-naphthoyl-CoA hydrolase